jgi:heme-degrading monooxygenase HmoA
MFVHVTSFHVSTGQIGRLRDRIAAGYLSLVRKQPGFVRGYFLEKVDDPETAQLIMVWESQATLESFRSSELMDAINKMLYANLPGLRMQGESYIARLRPEEDEVARSSG